MIELHNTTDWTTERISKYGKDITGAMHKLVERFPKDCTVESLAADIMEGRSQLWLVLDDEAFVLFGLTEIKTNPATGNKSVLITSLGGEDGVSSVPLIDGVESWARSIGAHEVAVCGRFGWKRALAAQGFKAETALYRKDI